MNIRSYMFNEHNLSDVLDTSKRNMAGEIDRMDRDYILNASPADLINYLEDKFHYEAPVLHENQIQIADEREVVKEVSDYGRLRKAKMNQITVAIPFSGNSSLFKCRPSTYTSGPPIGEIQDDREIHLTYAREDSNHEAIQSQLEKDLKEIRQYLQWLTDDIRKHNSNLRATAEQQVQARRERALSSAKLLGSLNIPIRQRDGKQPTYRAPEITRRIDVQRPVVKAQPFQPEPVISMTDYEDILQALELMIISMERSPATYQSMGEEDLRNLLLMQLNVTYQGRATGETFNKNGKTDILIREEDKNVFIAECKIWHGQGQFTEAIDQLLGYTCWRDTKTALLIFNRNKDHTAVLQQIEGATLSHPCCKKLLSKNDTGHFKFLICQPDDRNRELYLSVMVFHVPN